MQSHASTMGAPRRTLAAIVAFVFTFGVSAVYAQTSEENPSTWFDDDGWSSDAERDADWESHDVPPSGWQDDDAAYDALDADPRALTEFHPVLDPYGDWVQDARYGLVWVPSRQVVGDEFAPYLTHGRWALDVSGNWVWMSDFAFGSVVFHYGRWVWISGVGWAWVPGYRYSPAWVIWRVPTGGVSTVGWAPMPPAYVWVDGFAVGVGFTVTTPWIFCPSYYLFSRSPYRHRLRGHDRLYHAARHTKVYDAPPRRNGPTPGQAGVPPAMRPKARVPAQPTLGAGARAAGSGWTTSSVYAAPLHDPARRKTLNDDGRAVRIPRPEQRSVRPAPPSPSPRPHTLPPSRAHTTSGASSTPLDRLRSVSPRRSAASPKPGTSAPRSVSPPKPRVTRRTRVVPRVAPRSQQRRVVPMRRPKALPRATDRVPLDPRAVRKPERR